MKNSLELKETRSGLVETLESIKNTAEGESRNLNEAESIEVDNALKSIEDLDVKIERAEKVEKEIRANAVATGVKVGTPKADKDLEKFTYTGAMRAALSGNIEGIYKEMDQEARNEARYTGQNYKGLAIPSSILTRAWATADVNSVQTMSFTDQLEKNLVLASAGANTYFGVNNMKFPVFSGIGSTWVSEDGTSGAAAVTGNTSNVTLTPKKLISVVNMTQESFVQNAGMEAALTRNMATQVAASLEYALLDDGNVTNAPLSIFAAAATGPVTAFNTAAALSMENTLLTNGVQLEGARMAYLMNPEAYAKAKSEAMVSGVNPLYDMRDKTVNGYFAFVSGNVSASAPSAKDQALFGDFSKVHIAQFGGLDILFDPYTNATTGLPRMIVTSLVDGAAVQNSTAFVNLDEA
jgi:HK97 family phage major capsid protein